MGSQRKASSSFETIIVDNVSIFYRLNFNPSDSGTVIFVERYPTDDTKTRWAVAILKGVRPGTSDTEKPTYEAIWLEPALRERFGNAHFSLTPLRPAQAED